MTTLDRALERVEIGRPAVAAASPWLEEGSRLVLPPPRPGK